MLAIEVHRAQRDPFLARSTGNKILRQIRPVVRHGVIRAYHRDAAEISVAPQHLCRGVACSATAHDDYVFWRLRRNRGPFLFGPFFTYEELAAARFNLPG